MILKREKQKQKILFVMSNKIDQHLQRLVKKKDKTQIINNKNETRDITADKTHTKTRK
jgi:hypothetical protein